MPKVKDRAYYERRIAKEVMAISSFVVNHVADPQQCGKYLNCISRCRGRNLVEQYEKIHAEAERIKREILKSERGSK
jgi:hypothetical protein